jgi:hypothetical protein
MRIRAKAISRGGAMLVHDHCRNIASWLRRDLPIGGRVEPRVSGVLGESF